MARRGPKFVPERSPDEVATLQAAAKNRGESVLYALQKLKLSQHDLADQTGLSQSTISRFVRGDILQPDRRTMEAIEKWLEAADVDLHGIMGAPLEHSVAGTSRTLELKSGGTLTVIVSLDVLRLTSADRSFVFKLIDEIEQYESQGSAR